MSTGVIASILAPILVFLAAVFGVWMKRRTERQAAIDLKEKEDKERAAKAEADRLAVEAQRAADQYNAIKTDRDGLAVSVRDLRAEMDQMRRDMNEQMSKADERMDKARKEALDLWNRFAALRREFDAAEDHIADVHRWDETGRRGEMPKRAEVNNG